MSKPNGKTYSVQVLEVHSGDDLVLLVDLEVDSLYKKVRARLHSVDTPDAHRADPTTEAGKVRGDVHSLVRNRKCVAVVQDCVRSSWIVTLYNGIPDENNTTNLNEYLIERGYVFNRNKEVAQ